MHVFQRKKNNSFSVVGHRKTKHFNAHPDQSMALLPMRFGHPSSRVKLVTDSHGLYSLPSQASSTLILTANGCEFKAQTRCHSNNARSFKSSTLKKDVERVICEDNI